MKNNEIITLLYFNNCIINYNTKNKNKKYIYLYKNLK